MRTGALPAKMRRRGVARKRLLSKMIPRHPLAGAMAALALFAACGDQGPSDPDLGGEIAAQRALWEARRPPAYVYDVERLCFCHPDARGPVRVRVEGGLVRERAYVASGAPVPADLRELFPDVDGLFDLLEEAFERDAWEIRVTWDEESGAPADLWIDYDQRVADEELGFRMVSKPRPGASSDRPGAPYSPGAPGAPPAAATNPSRSPS